LKKERKRRIEKRNEELIVAC